MRPLLPSLGQLAALGNEPRVHPNGFIQLDLDDEHRLHVWHPRLPYRQNTYHPVHDHVFDFKSHVYSGRLVNVCYDVVPDELGSHVLWHAECVGGEESVLRPADDTGRMRLYMKYAEVKQPGEDYTFRAFTFHEILFNEPTLTIIRKCGPTIQQGATDRPSIAVPWGVEPDNDFRRDAVDQNALWVLIGEAYP